MSTALIAVIPMPLRRTPWSCDTCLPQKFDIPGVRAYQQGIEMVMDHLLVTERVKAALPIPTSPSSLITSTTSQLLGR